MADIHFERYGHLILPMTQIGYPSILPTFSGKAPRKNITLQQQGSVTSLPKNPTKGLTPNESKRLLSLLAQACQKTQQGNQSISQISLSFNLSALPVTDAQALQQELTALQEKKCITLQSSLPSEISCQLTPLGIHMGKQLKQLESKIQLSQNAALNLATLGIGGVGAFGAIKYLFHPADSHAVTLSIGLGILLTVAHQLVFRKRP